MKGTTHLVIALSSGMALSSLLKIPPKEIPWIVLLLGALAPDLDEDESTIAKPSKFLCHLLPKTLCDLLDSIGTGTSKLLKLLFGHRGFFHWPILAILIMALGYRYDIYWLSWFGFGYLTHVIADACTVTGVPLYAPIRQGTVQWSSLKTGSWGEKIIVLCCGLFIVFWGWSRIPVESQESLKNEVRQRIEKVERN